MSIDTLRSAIENPLGHSLIGLASSIEHGIPIYDCQSLRNHLPNGEKRDNLKLELSGIMLHGSGAFVLKGAFEDITVIDEATKLFLQIIEQEKSTKESGADHFAKSGANDRIWNSLEKLCCASPETFARYHGNQWIDLASESWLGPAYQMTAQVNLVRPGGAAQEAHCDYHLGFMTKDQANSYPPHVHAMSPRLTLQGAVAHCDMPIESGTTKLLPGSQNWSDNYVGFRDAEVRDLFEDKYVQLPLEKGDLLFFSPGILHGAGENRTSDIDRMANLLQVSSAFGQAMETIDRDAMCRMLYPTLKAGNITQEERDCAIANSAEGYPFPTNLDTDPPVGGLAPKTQQALMREALDGDWTEAKFNAELDKREARRVS